MQKNSNKTKFFLSPLLFDKLCLRHWVRICFVKSFATNSVSYVTILKNYQLPEALINYQKIYKK